MISWFSHGAASAVATKIALEEDPELRIILADTGSEHPDNARFLIACENWWGHEVEIIHNGKYENVDAVVEKQKFLRGPHGARCTLELKKRVRMNIGHTIEQQVFGYTSDKSDIKRAVRFRKNNPELDLRYPLIEQGISKQHCLWILSQAGIDIPMMYKLGFNNNNCLGCLKAESPDYWLLTKEHFPGVFEKRRQQQIELGYYLARDNDGNPIHPDDLEQWRKANPRRRKLKSFNCDFLCGAEE